MVRMRSVAVWSVVTAGVVLLAWLAWPVVAGLGATLRDPAGSPVAEAIVGASAAAGLLAAGWLWLVTTDVVVAVLRERPGGLAGGRATAPVRALVLAACGVAALGGTASAAPVPLATPVVAPAERDPGSPPLLHGLPLPDRAVGGERHRTTPPAAGAGADQGPAPRSATPAERDAATPVDGRVRVAPGDSLWAIAERALGPGATVAEIAAYWQRIHELNADVVGTDPDLIHPGQLLRLPSHP